VKINALEIDGYGVWSGLRIDTIPDGLSVLYGPNEAGKTTLLQFIRSMLYGFSADRRQYFPPVHGGNPGGMINIIGPPGRFEIARHIEQNDSGEEQIVLSAPDGTRQGEHLVKMLLSNIDEAIFNNIFAVELRELQELATLSDTETAELLYNLSAGLDRISLVEVMRELETSRNRILDADGKPCQVTQLWAEREKLRSAIEELGMLTRRWGHLVAERSQIDRDLTELEDEKNQAQRQLRTAELALAVRDRWAQRKAVDDQLTALGPLPAIPDGAIERLDAINSRLNKHRDRIDRLNSRQQSLTAEVAGIKINESLSRQSARIEALIEQEQWLSSLRTQIDELEAEIANSENTITATWRQLGLGDHAIEAVLPAISPRTLAALRSPAKTMQSCRVKLIQAKHEQNETEKTAESLSQQIETALSARQEHDLPGAMDRAGSLVAQYRRRLQIDERLGQLDRHQTDLEEQSQTLVEHQLLPIGVLAGLGAAFILGVMLILAGLFMPASITGSIGWALAVLGLAGSGAAAAGKFLMEKSRVNRLDACQKQLAIVQSHIEQAKTEREQLDAQLPRGGGPLSIRLEAAEKDLASLEELVPLETRRNAAAQQSSTAADSAAKATKECKLARSRWREALNAAGLPANLSTRQARQLFQQWQQLAESQRRIGERRDEAQHRRQDCDMLTARVAQVAADAGVPLDGSDAVEHLKQLGAALVSQEADVGKRESARRQIRHLRLRHAKHEEAASRLKHRRRALFFEAGAEDETEFRRRALQRARAEVLLRDRKTLTEDIAAAIGNQCSEEAIRKQLEEQPARELETCVTVFAERLAAADAQIRQCMEKRGELSANIQILADDRQLPTKVLELATVEKRLDDAINRWHVLASACRILDAIRTAYERERQPETLREASGYLNRLTQGRYQRVWTPLGENILRVDDADGHCLAVEMLSRGTREQLFLSLRMALAASYARRGAALPLVLDDVLVNFDADRATAASSVLCDFAAAGHQVLVLTCHEHIAAIFTALGQPVGRLPSNAKSGEAVVVFHQPVQQAEEELKQVRVRPTNRRKQAVKTISTPIAKPVIRKQGSFDADFFDSTGNGEVETSATDRNQPAFDEEPVEEDDVSEFGNGNSAKAA
jgi:uncharacterized protein YhaN